MLAVPEQDESWISVDVVVHAQFIVICTVHFANAYVLVALIVFCQLDPSRRHGFAMTTPRSKKLLLEFNTKETDWSVKDHLE